MASDILKHVIDPLTVDLSLLRSRIEHVLLATEELLGPQVVLDTDLYWHLPVDQAFAMSSEPTALTVGQVSDDLSTLADEPTEPQLVWHELAHLV